MIDLEPIWLTARLALITTGNIVCGFCAPAHWLAYTKWKGKAIIE